MKTSLSNEFHHSVWRPEPTAGVHLPAAGTGHERTQVPAPSTKHQTPSTEHPGPPSEAPCQKHGQNRSIFSTRTLAAARHVLQQERKRAGLAQCRQTNSFLSLSLIQIYIYINQITLILLFSSPRPLLTFPGS